MLNFLLLNSQQLIVSLIITLFNMNEPQLITPEEKFNNILSLLTELGISRETLDALGLTTQIAKVIKGHQSRDILDLFMYTGDDKLIKTSNPDWISFLKEALDLIPDQGYLIAAGILEEVKNSQAAAV
jgi:hypothetical protein